MEGVIVHIRAYKNQEDRAKLTSWYELRTTKIVVRMDGEHTFRWHL